MKQSIQELRRDRHFLDSGSDLQSTFSNENVPLVYSVGDIGPTGGFVFDVTNGGLNGLEAAPSDRPKSSWGCIGLDISAKDKLNGDNNTSAILAACSDVSIAARYASSYKFGGAYDWFLPALDQLVKMHVRLHLSCIGGFANKCYFSSTAFGSDSAAIVNFDSASKTKSISLRTARLLSRPIREF